MGRHLVLRLPWGWFVLFVVLVALLAPSGSPSANAEAPMNVGFTFSQRHAEALHLSWRDTFQAAMDLQPNLVRLGAYFDTIEPRPGEFDFSNLDWLLDQVPPESSVVLTVGMKAPRWPEYYLPSWLRREVQTANGGDVGQDARVRAETLLFISKVVERYRDRPAVGYWQVENEPLDAAGPKGWRIGADFLAQEVTLVRSLDARPIVMNMFFDTSPRGLLPGTSSQEEARARTLAGLTDVLGMDVYPVLPVAVNHHVFTFVWPSWSWERRAINIRRLMSSRGKQAWISEAQAEPWVSQPIASGTTIHTIDRLRADGFDTILLWGVEYWYMRSERYHDGDWWSKMKALFPQAQVLKITDEVCSTTLRACPLTA